MPFMDFSLFYDTHSKLVYNVALQYVQNIEEAEEITQDVFIKAHTKFSTFKGNSKIETWLYRITINTALDYIKAKKRKKRFAIISRSTHDLENATTFEHPGATLENKEALENLFIAINKLPDLQKTVLILLKIEDKSQQEVALILEKTPKAIESLFSRAKQNLKKNINQK